MKKYYPVALIGAMLLGLAISVLVTVFNSKGSSTGIEKRRAYVQVHEQKFGGYVVWINSDPEHWDADGKLVTAVAAGISKEYQLEPRNTDARDDQGKIYIRRIHLDAR